MDTTQTNLANSALAKRCIDELKEKHPNYSSSQIAKMVGISQATFSRIENGQTNPSLSSTSKLLLSLGKTHKISEAIEIVEQDDDSGALEKKFSHNLDTPIMAGDLASFFSNGDYRRILLLALTRSGTTRDEVALEYGKSGIRLLNEMIEAQVLLEVRGIIKADEEKVTFDQDILKDTLIDCISNSYDSNKLGVSDNWLSFQTESVDKNKAMGLIRAKLQNTYKEIKEEILYSSEYYGNDKVFVGMVADSILKEEVPATEVKQ